MIGLFTCDWLRRVRFVVFDVRRHIVYEGLQFIVDDSLVEFGTKLFFHRCFMQSEKRRVSFVLFLCDADDRFVCCLRREVYFGSEVMEP